MDSNNIGKTKIIATGVGIIIGIVAISVLIGLIFSWTPIPEGKVGVVTQWGEATGTVLTPGSNYIQPIRQRANEIPTRPQTVDMEGEDDIFVITEDGQDVWVETTIRYRVNKSKAVKFFSEYKNIDQAVNRLIQPTITSNIRNEASNITARGIITKSGRISLEESAEEALSKNFKGSGLELEAVQVRGVELNDEFAAKLEAVEIERTERERALIEANTTAEEEIIIAEGKAKANKELSSSLDEFVLTEQYINSIKDNDKMIIAGSGEDGQPIIIDPSNVESDTEE